MQIFPSRGVSAAVVTPNSTNYTSDNMDNEDDKYNKDKTNQISQITKLKSEIFDIIMQQETLNNQFNYLQNIKQQKLIELQKLQEK